jgi:hypothetical protein
MQNSLNVLKSVLSEFFRDNYYRNAVIQLRKAIKNNITYRNEWVVIVRLILNKELDIGVPLNLIQNNANLLLDENNDDEAYKWLTLMLINSLGCDDEIIIEY